MNLFDSLVSEALKKQPNLHPLRMVVEKELLHHDILKELSTHNLLANLTFIGGTCLRSCYGGLRLSEDLDFTGGSDFNKTSLSSMAQMLTDTLHEKYGLKVNVSEPTKDISNVDTWKIKIETRPEQRNLPAQRINIDICAVPSYEIKPMLLLNPYGVDMGTHGLIIQAQSREEIFTDKLIAFALRPNRIKYRDLWDIVWLYQQTIKPNLSLIPNKLHDRHYSQSDFMKAYMSRLDEIKDNKSSLSAEFIKEMSRFLPEKDIKTFQTQNKIWDFITFLMEEFSKRLE